MLVIAAPGQGAQTPGFLAPWLELPGVRDRIAAWSDLAGCDLIAYGTTASTEEIRDTAVAQPLLVAAGIAAAEVLFGGLDQAQRQSGLVAGHSVGELTAGTIAGVLAPEDAMNLVRVRGQAMARAAALVPTGMTAVLGGDEAAVLDAIESHGLTPANINGAGQVVAAGTVAQLAAFAADPPARARLIPVSVAGAFHTRYMTPAVEALRPAARRRGRPVGRRLAGRDRHPGERPGPVELVHAVHGQPRRDRAHRTAARGHPDRPGPAGAARRGTGQREKPGRPGGRPLPHRRTRCDRAAPGWARPRVAPARRPARGNPPGRPARAPRGGTGRS